MKTIYIKISFVLALLTSAYSCSSSFLDVDPSDGTKTPEAVTNLKQAEVALAGVYDAVQGRAKSPEYYGARMIYYGDVRGDDMQAAGSAKRTAATYMMRYTALNSPMIFEEPYKAIRGANRLLEFIEGGIEGEADKIAYIKGEALAVRALAHFDLLRVNAISFDVAQFGGGLGIPIVTKTLPYNAMLARNTVNETYLQIEADLKEALTLLVDIKVGNVFYRQSTGYINKWAVKSLQTRVHLYKDTPADNVIALGIAEDIITNSPYKLWTNETYLEQWRKGGTSEMIWEIVNYDDNDWVDREGLAYLLDEGGYADAVMTKKYLDFVKANYPDDVRTKLMLEAVVKNSPFLGDKVYIGKYPGREGAVNRYINNVPVFRLSEIYLTAAELAVRAGDAAKAANYINVILKRGNPNATDVTASEATLNRVLDEKRIEFVGEGHRYFDLLRNKKQIVRYTGPTDIGWHVPLLSESQSFDYTYFRAIFPIPDFEMLTNPVIREQQNPNY